MEIEKEILRKIQLLQLDIMKKVHAICEENDLKYIMLSGTLLGAVRHKGFIPWDDDLDIGLLRKDYEKLIQILTEHPIEGCFLQTYHTNKHYTQPYAKLRLNNTKYVENYCKDVDMHHGIFIDIFPLDKIKKPGGFMTECRRLIARCITFSIWRKENGYLVRSGLKKIEPFVSKMIGVLPKKVLINVQKALVVREKRQWEYVTSMFTSNYTTKKVYYKYSAFEHLRLFDFEDTKLYGPDNYDEVLRRLFKNYMELPAKDKQHSGHDIIEVHL